MRCGILHRAYVLRKENNKYMLDVISPYEALYSSVIIIGAGPGGIFSAYELTKHNGNLRDTLSYSQDGMCRRMFDELIDKLNYREKIVIDKLYGYRHDRCSVPELACELETDEEGVNSLKNSALDRLRDPDNYKYLEKRWYSGTDITNTEYELDFRRKLRAELQRYLAGQKSDIDILSAIMRRNKISVQRIYRNVQAAATDQGRFETSISGKKSIDDAVNASC